MHRNSSALLLLTALLANLSLCFGQTNEYVFKHLSVADGLSQSSVNAIFQDKKGFVWFGTEDGLNKFDGLRFRIYKKDPFNHNSIAHSWIWDIDQDKSGKLWVATWDGLSKIDLVQNKIINYRPIFGDSSSLSSSRPDCLLFTSDGRLWIGTWGGGLNLYLEESDNFRRYQSASNDTNSINNNFVRTLYEDKDRNLWIGTWGGGLNKYNQKQDSFSHLPTASHDGTLLYGKEITAISDGPDDQLWIGTYENGISILNKKDFSFIELNDAVFQSLKNRSITAIYKDDDGLIWIGTQNHGIYIYHHGEFLHINQQTHGQSGFRGNFIYSVFQDRSGTVYIGNSGISLYHKTRTKFKHVKKSNPGEEGLSAANVWSFAGNSKNQLFIGLENNGLNVFDYKTDKIIPINQPPYQLLEHSYPRALAFDQHENLWIGTIGEGVFKISASTGEIISLNEFIKDKDFKSQLRINALVAHKDSIFIGTVTGGIYVYDQKHKVVSKLKVSYNDTVRISSEYINTILVDGNENIWTGGWGGGVGFLKKGTNTLTRYFQNDQNTQSLSNNIVNCLYEDKSGMIWIGTNQGLNKIVKPKSGSFNSFDENIKKYFQRDGLANEVIYAIEGDDHGNLWISTNGGLSKFDPQSEQFTNFNLEDGLQENEFNGKSSLKLNDGRIVFGGINGFNIFHPDSIKQDTSQPPVVLTNISIFGIEQNVDSIKSLKPILRLPYNQNFISLEYAALDFVAPQKIHYSYKLHGLDQDFIDAQNRRYVNYTNLPPGLYQFIVKNTNRDGVWNIDPLTFEFEIMAPFWRTWWFISLGILIIFTIIYLLFQLRLSRILEIERIRTNIANDLHDDIGSSLTKISLYSDLIQSGADNKKTSAYLRDISALSRDVIGSMSDIIWSIDIRHDRMQDLVDRMKEFAFSVCEPANIAIFFNIQGIEPDKSLKPVFRQNIYLIYKEAINNILKHSGADKVYIDLIQSGHNVTLRIADNGIGTSRSQYNFGGHGLINMKNRARKFNGQVDFQKKNGFQVTIRFKFAKALGAVPPK